MKNIVIIIGLVVALGVGGAAGYFSGKSPGTTSSSDKKLQESIGMMKEQTSKIEKMGEMMKSGGVMMQEMGMKYNDEVLTTKGKDLETVAAKYIDENKKSENKDTMKPIMGN